MDSKLFNLKNTVKVAVFTLVAFIGFNSFTESNRPMADLSWTFTGTNPIDSSQYNSGAPIDPCAGTATVCELVAPDNNADGLPDMDAIVALPGNPKVKDRIQAAILSGSPNETVPFLRAE